MTHYTSSFRPLSPGDLLLLIDTIEVMTSRMKNDLGTIPTLDQRRAVITEVVQVCFFCCVAVLTIWRSYFKLHCQKWNRTILKNLPKIKMAPKNEKCVCITIVYFAFGTLPKNWNQFFPVQAFGCPTSS